jgi:hypothetical protein
MKEKICNMQIVKRTSKSPDFEERAPTVKS